MDLAVLCLDHDAADLALDVTNAGLAQDSRHRPVCTRYVARIHADRANWTKQRAISKGPQTSARTPSTGSVGLSLVLRQNAQLPEAITLLRSKLAQKPQDSTLNYLLGDALLRTELAAGTPAFREAEQAFRRALRDETAASRRCTRPSGSCTSAPAMRAPRPQSCPSAAKIDPTDRLALNQLVMVYPAARARSRGRDRSVVAESTAGP